MFTLEIYTMIKLNSYYSPFFVQSGLSGWVTGTDPNANFSSADDKQERMKALMGAITMQCRSL